MRGFCQDSLKLLNWVNCCFTNSMSGGMMGIFLFALVLVSVAHHHHALARLNASHEAHRLQPRRPAAVRWRMVST
jgi:hypothetical protein